MDTFPPRVPDVPMPPSPPIALPTAEIEALRDEAYTMGRLDERVRNEARALDDVVYRPRAALPPRVIQRRASVRLVDPREAARERHEDAMDQLDRLRLDEELRFDEQFRYEDSLASELREQEFRRREELAIRHRQERGDYDLVDIEDDLAWEERLPRGYMRGRESEREPRVHFANPFTPLSGRSRRHSMGFP